MCIRAGNNWAEDGSILVARVTKSIYFIWILHTDSENIREIISCSIRLLRQRPMLLCETARYVTGCTKYLYRRCGLAQFAFRSAFTTEVPLSLLICSIVVKSSISPHCFVQFITSPCRTVRYLQAAFSDSFNKLFTDRCYCQNLGCIFIFNRISSLCWKHSALNCIWTFVMGLNWNFGNTEPLRALAHTRARI
jgi:hypothetical protein